MATKWQNCYLLQHHVILVFFKSVCTCFSWALGISWAKSSSLQCLTLMRQLLADGTAKPIPLPWIQQVINPIMWSLLTGEISLFFVVENPGGKQKHRLKVSVRSQSPSKFSPFLNGKFQRRHYIRSPKVWKIGYVANVAMPPCHKYWNWGTTKTTTGNGGAENSPVGEKTQMVVDCKGIHPQQK